MAKKEVLDKQLKDMEGVKETQSKITERLNQLERSGFTGGGSQQEAATGIVTILLYELEEGVKAMTN
jgi:hypothetical protein